MKDIHSIKNIGPYLCKLSYDRSYLDFNSHGRRHRDVVNLMFKTLSIYNRAQLYYLVTSKEHTPIIGTTYPMDGNLQRQYKFAMYIKSKFGDVDTDYEVLKDIDLTVDLVQQDRDGRVGYDIPPNHHFTFEEMGFVHYQS